jgi:putative addiction module killer protein
MRLEEYLDKVGESPFGEWFADLPTPAAAKVTVALTRMSAGNFSWVEPVGEGVSEFKIDFGPGYRLYFGQDGASLVILLVEGSKKRQWKDIERAKIFWADYKARKKERR